MIENIIWLLVATSLTPLVPFSPFWLSPLAVGQVYFEEASMFHLMSLNRVHKEEQFKKTFRESIKKHHPDLGGNQATFAQIKDLKDIMEQKDNPYDRYNVTHVDLAHGSTIADVVENKELAYFVQTWIFYFITLMYVLIFANSEKGTPCKKYALVLLLGSVIYEMNVYFGPEQTTLFDIIDPKTPLFVQFKLIKRTLIIFLAIICTHYSRKANDEYKLLHSFDNSTTSMKEHIEILEAINKLMTDKIIHRDIQNKKIITKIKKVFSKILAVLFFLLLIKSVIF